MSAWRMQRVHSTGDGATGDGTIGGGLVGVGALISHILLRVSLEKVSWASGARPVTQAVRQLLRRTCCGRQEQLPKLAEASASLYVVPSWKHMGVRLPWRATGLDRA